MRTKPPAIGRRPASQATCYWTGGSLLCKAACNERRSASQDILSAESACRRGFPPRHGFRVFWTEMKTEKHGIRYAGRTEGDRLAKIPHAMAFSQVRDVLRCRLFLCEPFCRSRSRLWRFSVFLSVHNRRFCCRGTQRNPKGRGNGSHGIVVRPVSPSLWVRTSGLDGANMKRTAEAVERLALGGRAIFVITHDFEFIASCCTRIVRIEEGVVVRDVVVSGDRVAEVREAFFG